MRPGTNLYSAESEAPRGNRDNANNSKRLVNAEPWWGRGSTADKVRVSLRPIELSQGFLELLPLPPPNQSNLDF